MIDAGTTAPAQPDAGGYWTKEQARAFLGGVSARKLERMRVRHYRVGGLVRYTRADLVEFMERHAVEVTPRRRQAKTTTPARPRSGGTARAPSDWLADFAKGDAAA